MTCDLEAFINSQKNEGMSIILGMDANANPDDPQSMVAKLKNSCKLTDPIKEMNPNPESLPTYTRGRWRIDMFLTTPDLSKAILNIQILPFGYAMQSDH